MLTTFGLRGVLVRGLGGGGLANVPIPGPCPGAGPSGCVTLEQVLPAMPYRPRQILSV